MFGWFKFKPKFPKTVGVVAQDKDDDNIDEWRFKVIRVSSQENLLNLDGDSVAVSSIEDKYDTSEQAVAVLRNDVGFRGTIYIVK